LASELGIARGTVVTAFQMLAGEGYTVSAGGEPPGQNLGTNPLINLAINGKTTLG